MTCAQTNFPAARASLAQPAAFSPQTTGTAPNRHFNIEWRAVHFADTTTSANFEVVFYENQSSFFDVFYGATSDNGLDETSGVQASSSGPATTFSCGTATLTNGLKVTYMCAGGGTPTPTATATATASCTPSSFHVLIAYADTAPPTQLQSEILAEPGVIAVDLFDAQSALPLWLSSSNTRSLCR